MDERVKAAAERAEQHPSFRVAARCGHVANGLVHGIIGVFALMLAWTGSGQSDQSQAFQTISEAPFGAFALWLLAAVLVALGVYYVVNGFSIRISDTKQRWSWRISEWGRAVIYLVLGFVAGKYASGSRSDGEQSAEQASGGLLQMPGGPFLLAIAGIAIGIAGVVFIVIGVRRGFRKRVKLPKGPGGRAIEALGAFGYVAKGASLGVVGGLVVTAAIKQDPDAAGALDAAIRLLKDLPAGTAIVTAMGIGFLAYALFCVFRARYDKL